MCFLKFLIAHSGLLWFGLGRVVLALIPTICFSIKIIREVGCEVSTSTYFRVLVSEEISVKFLFCFVLWMCICPGHVLRVREVRWHGNGDRGNQNQREKERSGE